MTPIKGPARRVRKIPSIQSLDDLQPDPLNANRGTDRGMSRALLKLSSGSVHDYATISDDSPSPRRASRARRAATSAGIS